MRNFEADEKEKARAHELVVRKAGGTPGTGRNSSIDVQRNIKLVPEFNEKEVDGFFLLFEKVADRLEWPSKIRTLLLQSVLKGKAQIIYAALDTSQCEDYDVVKREILKAYELVPEAYRRKFRDMSKGDGITYMDHARNLEIACDRWCVSRDIGEEFTKLRELVLVEQFKNKLPDSIKTFLDEKEINELKKAASSADDYALTHKFVSRGAYHGNLRGHRGNDKKFVEYGPGRNGTATDSKQFANTSHSGGQKNTNRTNDRMSRECKKCGKAGHSVADCWSDQKCGQCGKLGHISIACARFSRGNATATDKNNMLLNVVKSMTAVPNVDKGKVGKSESVIKGKLDIPVDPDFAPFVSKGRVKFGQTNIAEDVIILRDTGAAQSLLCSEVVTIPSESFTGDSLLVHGIGGGFESVPLCEIELQSEVIKGVVSIGVTKSCPVRGISLVLGNDLAGERVKVQKPLLGKYPQSDFKTDMLENDFPGIFPACVTTRAMSRKPQVDTEYDLSQTFMNWEGLSEENGDHESIAMSEETRRMTRSSMIEAQKTDPEVSVLRTRMLTLKEANQHPVCFYEKNGLLMRKWRPRDLQWQVMGG